MYDRSAGDGKAKREDARRLLQHCGPRLHTYAHPHSQIWVEVGTGSCAAGPCPVAVAEASTFSTATTTAADDDDDMRRYARTLSQALALAPKSADENLSPRPIWKEERKKEKTPRTQRRTRTYLSPRPHPHHPGSLGAWYTSVPSSSLSPHAFEPDRTPLRRWAVARAPSTRVGCGRSHRKENEREQRRGRERESWKRHL